ncbi:protein spinster homolog 3-like isoform X1 [Empidonax traillii]|uniref:protein spinster homolog 3-like isoform X1 n=1 Tax=Empidonax traillii TaxID=164674 RepID=UPI000FFD39BB|nr:protein spinster homolog 3-like isoform X1 [Empidonax traillii]
MQPPCAQEDTGLQLQPLLEGQNYGAAAADGAPCPAVSVPRSSPTKRVLLMLCFGNLLNSMDWFLVPGILLDIQKYFGLSDEKTGLLQTVFTVCYMLAAPIFGYLGDRYNRKILLGAGILLWSGVTLGSSFITQSYYWMFVLSRGLVGIGTASYSTIAPTIIADLFEEGKRTTVLSLFYIFIPVGSGCGYVLAAGMARSTGDWHWAFRVTPCMGGLALLLLLLLVPHRTQRRTARYRALSISGTTQGADETPDVHRTAETTWCQDVGSLAKNCSFVWSSLGVAAMTFVTGALGMWVPLFLYRAQLVQGIVPPCLQEPCSSSSSLIFGAITIGTGVLGITAGARVTRRLRKIYNKADPLICATSMFISALCLYTALVVAQTNILSTFIFIALGELFLFVIWAVATDMLLCVVSPRCRSTAIALQILLSHLLGDAGSPFLIGAVSNALQARGPPTFQSSFRSIQSSFAICAFVGAFGGAFFLLTALSFEGDRREAERP